MMNHIKARGVLAVMLLIVMLFSCACSAAPAKSSPVSAETLPFYFLSAEDCTDTEVFFMNGNRQIPYVSPETWQSMFLRLYNEGCIEFPADPDAALELACDGGTVTYTRENGSTMTLDFQKDLVTFSDFDAFTAHSYSATLIDILHTDCYNDKDEPEYLGRLMGSYDRSGGEVSVDLAAYGLDFIYLDGKYYIPVQIMADLLITFSYVNFLYNTQSLMFFDYDALADEDGNLKPLGEIYYAAQPQERTQELIDFTYGELCMQLDCFFGLKEAQDIQSFDELFARTYLDGVPLRERLKSSSCEDVDQAIAHLCNTAIGDLHSSYLLPSYATGADIDVTTELGYGNSIISYMLYGLLEYEDVRAEYYPDGVPGYEEIGNTAYVTFDTFDLLADDYYANPADETTTDTIGLIEYAHSRICRENSPIENVVLDLSCNSGGEEDTAIYVIAWMLGDATMHMKDTFSGATATTYYVADVNMDHDFTEEDTVYGYNLYCLISPASFSCGNLVPSALKSSGAVTLIGQASGGGACAVQPLTTASGNIFQISGYKRLSTMQNGSYYPIDQGIQPHFFLDKTDSFYDREALTDYINQLY